MTNHYELLYLVAPNCTEEELEPIKQKVTELIKKFGGQITLEDSFGKKKLAYPIAKNHQGYYLLYEFDLDGAQLKELSRSLKLTSEIMRHIIVKKNLSRSKKFKASLSRPRLTMTAEPTRPTTDKKEKKDDDKDKVKLEDLDEKLDQILEGDIM